MANWNTLKTAVADAINTNGNQEITGQILQNVLNSIITNVGENATFVDVATPETNPGTPDGPVFYLATTVGTYPNFNGIEVQDGEAAILLWGNNKWSKKATGLATQKKLTELGQEVENKSTSTYLKNIAKFDNAWIAYQGVMDVNDSSKVTFTTTSTNSNVYKTLEFGSQLYNTVVISGSIDTKGLTSNQYMQAIVYTQDGKYYTVNMSTPTSITGTVYHYQSVFEKESAITKIILRFRVPDSNGITVEFIKPFVIGLKNKSDLEFAEDWFADVKPYHADYASVAKEAEIAKELNSASELYTTKADAAKFPLNLVLDSKFKDLNWLFPAVTSYEVNNGIFEVKKVSTATGIMYQTFEFSEQAGDYVYLSLKIKTAYSLTTDTYLEAIVYYSDGNYMTLTGQSPVDNVDGYYYLEVARAITKPINKIIYRIRLKNINGIDNAGVFIKEPFAAVITSKDYEEIYKGNALYYEKNNTSVAASSLVAFKSKSIDLESFFQSTTPLAGKKLLTLGDSITFGKKWQPQLCRLTGMNFLEDAIFTEYASNITIEVQHLEESKKTVLANNYPIGSGNTNGFTNVATAIGGSAVRAVAVESSEGNAVDGSAVEVDGVSFSVGRGPGESLFERSKSVHVYSPDIIIIMGGQNDGSLAVGSAVLGSMDDAPYNGGYILQSEYNSLDSLQRRKYSFYAMYKGMLLNLIKNNPKAAIYCCGTMRCLRKQYADGTYNEDATINYFYEKMLPDIKTKNAAIKEIAEYYGCKYIDLEGLSISPWNNTHWSSDTGDSLVHPNIERGNMMAISIRNQM